MSPSLFNIYMKPLFDLLENQKVMFTNFADNTQLLINLSDNFIDQHKIKSIYGLIKERMSCNWMCLKNGMRLVASLRKLPKLQTEYSTMCIDDCTINILQKVKTLGVTLDSALTMDSHTSALVSTTWFHL